MNNEKFEQMRNDDKVIFFLGLSEKVVDVFSREEDQKIARNALNTCWEWLQKKEYIGEILYDLLDDEEKGIVSIQEMSEVKKDEAAWDCIIDSVAFTSRKAFEGEGVKYFPESIELVDDTLVDHFIDSFKACVLDAEKYIRNINSILGQYRNDDYDDLKTIIQEKL